MEKETLSRSRGESAPPDLKESLSVGPGMHPPPGLSEEETLCLFKDSVAQLSSGISNKMENML